MNPNDNVIMRVFKKNKCLLWNAQSKQRQFKKLVKIIKCQLRINYLVTFYVYLLIVYHQSFYYTLN